jgi:hypothetical protein
MFYKILICFMGGFLVDLFYVYWIAAVEKESPYRAGTFAVMIAACSTFSFLDIVNQRWLVVPYFAGIFAGTVMGVTIKKRNSK